MASPARRAVALRLFALLASLSLPACGSSLGFLLYGVPAAGAGVGMLAWEISSKPEDGTWIRIDSRHFALDTDLAPLDAKTVVRELESWEAALEQAVFADEAAGPNMIAGVEHVVALRTDWERTRVAGGDLLGFYGEPDVVPPFVLVGDPLSLAGRQTLKHEVVHAFVHRRWPAVPRWLDEGLARYLQTSVLDPHKGTVTWGGLNGPKVREYALSLRSPTMSDLLSSDSWRNRDRFVMSWRAAMLVHMLMTRDRAGMHCYLNSLASDSDSNAALQVKGCFPRSDGWQADVDRYELSTSFTTATASVSSRADVEEPTRVSPAQVHALLAMVDVGLISQVERPFKEDRRAHIRENLQRALELDSEQPIALVLAVEWLGLPAGEQATRSTALIAAHPYSWRLWLLRARTAGLARDELEKTCVRLWDLAPDGMDEERLLPCRDGHADDRGRLAEGEIAAVFHARQEAFEACYAPAAARVPSVSGNVAVRYTIKITGQVVAAEIVRSTVQSPELETCILGVIRGMYFPQQSGGDIPDQQCRFMFMTTSSGGLGYLAHVRVTVGGP